MSNNFFITALELAPLTYRAIKVPPSGLRSVINSPKKMVVKALITAEASRSEMRSAHVLCAIRVEKDRSSVVDSRSSPLCVGFFPEP